ncbi:hypothetical protein NDU88_005772 [Pleurodeles waltl]|uniref:Uncharacterized protein n=1 Tax=Pleurodeles waltl TaxID=8319 RepID=A0AAV7MXE6_PLEWA|nr:hypothetical protein NDU88_005772 [Pleurodeles waltl]
MVYPHRGSLGEGYIGQEGSSQIRRSGLLPSRERGCDPACTGLGDTRCESSGLDPHMEEEDCASTSCVVLPIALLGGSGARGPWWAD